MGGTTVNPGMCFAKTPQGVDAVRNRTHGLAPRVRQLLIMIDGRRDLASLLQIFAADILPGMLAQLTQAGLVQQVQQQAAPGPVPAPATAPMPAASRPTPLSPMPAGLADEDPFVLAQTFMVNLAKRILGVAGDPIIARLRAAHDLQGLRGLYPEWRSTIKQAPDGLLRLKELEKKLSKVLGELPPA